MHQKFFQFIWFGLLCCQLPAAGQAVSLRCLDVQPGGDVMVRWKPLGIGSSFSDYTIFTSHKLTGIYSIVAVIDVMSQDNYLHTGAGANADTLFYYILTDQGAGGITVTDTLSAIFLTSSTIDYESVSFSWSPLHYPEPFTQNMHPWYLLYREYPPGIVEVVDSTQSENIGYHFWDCNFSSDTVRFRIGVRDDDFGCISFSNQVSRVLKNLSNRFPPVIDSVSVDASGKVVIGWEPAFEPDIIGYYLFIITQTIPPTKDTVDYISGRFNTGYTHQQSDPCNGIYSYLIKSVDSCSITSPFPYDSATFLDLPQSNIYLADILYDPCSMTNSLNWNEYQNFDPPIVITYISVSENGGAYYLLDSVYPGQVSYFHSGLSPNTTYSYYVRAYSGDRLKTSTSCRKAVRTYNSPSPLFMYTRYVTVENNDRVNILFYTDTNAHVQYYRILRSTDAGGPFVEAGIAQDQGQETVSFTDLAADVMAGSYYYQVEVVDSCGVPSVMANTARTIYLQVEALPDMHNLLVWNAYASWSGRVDGYRIYRRADLGTLELIGQVDSTVLEYDDNVSALTGSYSRISYIVAAFEGDGNQYGFSEESYSNEALAEQEPKIYLPNAISPKGINNILKPVTVFVGEDGYELVIYNRWGELLFSTRNPDEGWNGTYNGQYVPQGVYVCLINYTNALGQPRQARRNVVVIY